LELLRAGLGTVKVPFEEFSENKIIPRFNVAPSQQVPIVRLRDGKGELAFVRWGLIPYWSKKKPKIQPINAKAETVSTSGMFRGAFQRRRCLVPADGFYEWQKHGAFKQPYFIHKSDDSLFCFAGLWESWKPLDSDDVVETVTLITTPPNPLMENIHNRMPAILRQQDYERWLNPETPADELQSMLVPFPDELVAYPISTHVNSPRNDDAECIKEIDP
jgi:putative SOS response-associated peptidase YedK